MLHLAALIHPAQLASLALSACHPAQALEWPGARGGSRRLMRQKQCQVDRLWHTSYAGQQLTFPEANRYCFCPEVTNNLPVFPLREHFQD